MSERERERIDMGRETDGKSYSEVVDSLEDLVSERERVRIDMGRWTDGQSNSSVVNGQQ